MLALILAVAVLAVPDNAAVARTKPKQRTVLDQLAYVPAPRRASLLYEDKLENAGLPASAYANTDTMTVHAPKGQELGEIEGGHELGHLFDAQILTDGDRHFFSKLLGTDPNYWRNMTGGNPGQKVAGTEAFSDYYTAAANKINLKTGGYTGYVTIDPKIARKFNAALGRLAKRHKLDPLDLQAFLASGR